MVKQHLLSSPLSLSSLFLYVMPERIIEPRYAALPNCFMISPAKVKRHLDYQTGIYVDEGYGVAQWKNMAWEVLVPPTGNAPSAEQFNRLAAMLPTLLIDQTVFWSAKDGFQPRPGALGLAQPRYDIAWKTETGYGRLVVGQKLEYDTGYWAYLFNNLTQDAQGNPHPRGIFRLINFWPEVFIG